MGVLHFSLILNAEFFYAIIIFFHVVSSFNNQAVLITEVGPSHSLCRLGEMFKLEFDLVWCAVLTEL
jgi:hypothetical protein